MARIFITGSTDGLGRAAAQALINEGHEMVLHARSQRRVAAIGELMQLSAGIAVGDLASAAETTSIADQVNAIGRMDAVIHNAGVYTARSRASTLEGHAGILAVNTLAPYMLTALMERPGRSVYLTAACTEADRVHWGTSTGRNAPEIRLRPTPKASCTWSRSPSRRRDVGRSS